MVKVAKWCLIASWLIGLGATASAKNGAVVKELRCEYRANPLGIDVHWPRLSWILESDQRGQKQTAYRVLVASRKELIEKDRGDLWDSGRVNSDQSIQVPYAGAALLSYQQCFWKVRVWDKDSQPTKWSQPALWTMGLLKPSDWHGQWIGLDQGPEPSEAAQPLDKAHWIWFPDDDPVRSAPPERRYFRRAFTLPEKKILSARCLITADNQFKLFINGNREGDGSSFQVVHPYNIAEEVHPGRNVLAVAATNAGDSPNPAGLIGVFMFEFEGAEPLLIITDQQWKTSERGQGEWQEHGYDDSQWKPAMELGLHGIQPWGQVRGEENRRLPARHLRREFKLTKPIRQATAHVCGLGLYELYLNGGKMGDRVLDPALTEYPKRAFYVTFDITRCLRQGKNAVGVWLGNGRYFAPRSDVPTGTTSFGYPKLLLEMRIEYEDSMVLDVVSDERWKLTTEGPIRANNEYDGEEYDARMEMPGWSKAGFDDSGWQQAQKVDPPGGILASQMSEPIRIIESIQPVRITNPKPGVYIYDMGQNIVGWCRLKVRGPRGTSVRLRHAEILNKDGLLYLDNIRSAKVTDVYTLKGGGVETYEPRFTYHGFRFVEMTGYPGEPTLSSIEGRVVHDAVEQVSEFSCSDLLINQIHKNIFWGVRGNYRSVPTDCPQRDERQGWLGDRSEESKGECYLFDLAAFYDKWVTDIHDAQRDNGSVPDVAPSYWPVYSDNVTWPSSFIIIPGHLYEHYADRRVLETHYDGMKKWVDYMSDFLEDSIMPRDQYGDWCVPPESKELIHSQDPNRKTDKKLIATAYFCHDLRLMARYARILDKSDDAERFDELAEKLRAAFNKVFLNKTTNVYDNGTQTSSVLPLAFGMVPEAYREPVFQSLVDNIRVKNKGHLATGLIGCQWLMRTLSDNGRADVAYRLASNRDYPSWGYMIEHGATTIWELWNGNTADPAMNSHNHVMLVGDLVTWLYAYLAGIRPDPDQPGFKHIVMRPHPVGDLQFVRASHRSIHGLIASHWKIENGNFHWRITVPGNTTATVYVPAANVDKVTEGGVPALEAEAVSYAGMQDGRAVFKVQSGNYLFESSGAIERTAAHRR